MKKEIKIEREIQKLIKKRNSLQNEIAKIEEELETLKESTPSFEETITITGYQDEYCSQCNRMFKINECEGEHGPEYSYHCGVYDAEVAYGTEEVRWIERLPQCLKAGKKSAKSKK